MLNSCSLYIVRIISVCSDMAEKVDFLNLKTERKWASLVAD